MAAAAGEPKCAQAVLCVTGDSVTHLSTLQECLGSKVRVKAIGSVDEARFEALSMEPLCSSIKPDRYPVVGFLGVGKASARFTVRDSRRGTSDTIYTSDGGDLGFTKHDHHERMRFVESVLERHNKGNGLEHRPLDFLVLYAGAFHRTPKAFQMQEKGTLPQMSAEVAEQLVEHPLSTVVATAVCPPAHVLRVGDTLGDGILPVSPEGHVVTPEGVMLLAGAAPVMSMRKVVPTGGPNKGKLLYVNYLSAFSKHSGVSSKHWFDVGSGEIGYTSDPSSGDARKTKHDGGLASILGIVKGVIKSDKTDG